MTGLADCNNFFVSCERSVHPELEGKAVVVMSNNDGCIVARSNEAKRMGIKMGQPVFEVKDLIRAKKLIAISGHHLLYKKISIQVHDIFRRYAPATIDYSVDEAFLDMDGIPDQYLMDIGRHIYRECWEEARIPVTIGFARTKTLAKIATEVSKKAGVPVCVFATPEEEFAAMEHLSIADLWGIGRRLAKRLYTDGVFTVADFARRDVHWVRQFYGVNGERSWRELNGEPCISLAHVNRPLQDSISESRTFPADINDFNYIRARIAMYTDHCARRLRMMKGMCRSIGVFLRTNRFDDHTPYQALDVILDFDNPVHDTPTMVRAAIAGLEHIFDPRFSYKRAGIWLADIVHRDSVAPSLFDQFDPPAKTERTRRRERLLKVIDKINAGDSVILPLASELTHTTPRSNDGYSSSFQFRK